MEWYQSLTLFLTVAILLITALGSTLWFIVTSTIKDLKDLQDSLTDHKLDNANNYAKIADVKASYEKVFMVLNELKDAVNKIATSVSVLETKVEIK